MNNCYGQYLALVNECMSLSVNLATAWVRTELVMAASSGVVGLKNENSDGLPARFLGSRQLVHPCLHMHALLPVVIPCMHMTTVLTP